MARPAKTERNADLMEKRREGWSMRRLGEHFNIDVRAVWEIIKREESQSSR